MVNLFRVWRHTTRAVTDIPSSTDDYYGWAHVGVLGTQIEAEAIATRYEDSNSRCFIEPISYNEVEAITPNEAQIQDDPTLAQKQHVYEPVGPAIKYEEGSE